MTLGNVSPKKTGILLSLLFLIGLTGLIFVTRSPAEVQKIEMQPEFFRQVVTATGKITGSPIPIQSEVTARILEITVEEGDYIQAGQGLIQLDRSGLQRELRQREADLAVAQAQHQKVSQRWLPEAQESLSKLMLERESLGQSLELEKETLQRRLDRERILYEQGAFALEPLEETESEMALLKESMTQLDLLDLGIASAQREIRLFSPGGSDAQESEALLALSQVQVETLQEELLNYQLVSPVSGRVLERQGEVGELAESGATLMTIGLEGSLVAEVEIDERNIGLFEVGQPATLWPEAFPSRAVAATVEKISPQVNTDTGTVMVQLALEEKEDFLIQDLTIQAEIIVREVENALLLPVAFLQSRDPAKVYLQGEDGMELTTLPKTEYVGLEKMLVLEGLQHGDIVLHP